MYAQKVPKDNQGSYRQVKFKDISWTSKTPTVFKDYKFMRNTDLSDKILLQIC